MIWSGVRAQQQTDIGHGTPKHLALLFPQVSPYQGAHTPLRMITLSLPALTFCKSTHTQRQGQVVFQGQYTLMSLNSMRCTLRG